MWDANELQAGTEARVLLQWGFVKRVLVLLQSGAVTS